MNDAGGTHPAKRNGFFVFVSKCSEGREYDWREVAHFPTPANAEAYWLARAFAIARLSDNEMVRVIDDKNRIVFFEWRSKS